MEQVKLGDLISLVIDYRGKTPLKLKGEWASEGYRALSALNVKTGGLVAEDKIRYVDEELYHRWMKQEIVRGDILITSEAPFGQVLQWNSDEKIVLSQRLFAIRIKPDIDNRYVYHYMTSQPFQGELKARATGSTVEGLRQPALMKCRLILPELPVQRKIASILSSYDSLIEANTRRIRLLEQMAENLYKEWFVRFRFPVREKVKMVDGLPEGWKVIEIKDLVQLQSGYPFKSTTFIEDGEYKIVTIKNVKDSQFDGLNVSCINEIPTNMPKYCQLNQGDILLSLTGNIGRVCLVVGQKYLLNQRVAKLKTNYPSFIYNLFKSSSMFASINNLANGAAQQNVSPIKIGRIKICINQMMVDAYEEITSRLTQHVLLLTEQNNLLSRQRDLLLPRLMSGKLEITL